MRRRSDRDNPRAYGGLAPICRILISESGEGIRFWLAKNGSIGVSRHHREAEISSMRRETPTPNSGQAPRSQALAAKHQTENTVD